MSQDELTKNKVPDPEVVPRAKRSRFNAEYKLRIREEADACSEPGEIGALLCQEGLYSAHQTTWRRLSRESEIELAQRSDHRSPRVAPSRYEVTGAPLGSFITGVVPSDERLPLRVSSAGVFD